MANAPIDVRAYAQDRRKALAARIASMVGRGQPMQAGGRAGGRGPFGGGNSLTPQTTFPYLQNRFQEQGLGVVNSGDPSDPYSSSQYPGGPIMSPRPPMLPVNDTNNPATSPHNFIPQSGDYSQPTPAQPPHNYIPQSGSYTPTPQQSPIGNPPTSPNSYQPQRPTGGQGIYPSGAPSQQIQLSPEIIRTLMGWNGGISSGVNNRGYQ